MTPESYLPDPSRFLNSENEAISLLMMYAIVVTVYVVWKEIIAIRKDSENSKTFIQLTVLLNKIYEAIGNEKK